MIYIPALIYSSLYTFIITVYHLYIILPHLPGFRKLLELYQSYPVENYKYRKCSTKELQNISKGPESIGTALGPSTGGSLEMQISRLCEDAAQILVWAAQTPNLERLVIYDSSCLLLSNGLELHHTINAALDRLPSAMQRDVTTRFANQQAINMDLEVIFTDPTVFRPEQIDLFVSFDGMSHGYPLPGLADAVIFSPYRRALLKQNRPQLLEYITAIKVYEQSVRSAVVPQN